MLFCVPLWEIILQIGRDYCTNFANTFWFKTTPRHDDLDPASPVLRLHKVIHTKHLSLVVGLQMAAQRTASSQSSPSKGTFFQSVSKCLEMSQAIKDEIAYFSRTIATCYQPTHCWKSCLFEKSWYVPSSEKHTFRTPCALFNQRPPRMGA